MQQGNHLSHDEYCRILGELYLDAHLRIQALEKQSSGTNPLPLIQSLQNQIANLRKENEALKSSVEPPHEAMGT